MTYRIVSPRIGTHGDIYEPEAGVNVEALLAGGFIVATVSTETAPKRRKVKPAPEE